MQSTIAVSWRNDGDGTNDDAALVRAAREQRAAFAPLYHRYRDRIFWYVRSHVPSEEDAADLTQQIFVRALDGLPGYRTRRGPFAAWLFTIARNTVTNHHRRQRITIAWDLLPEASQPATAHTPEAEILHREDLARLRTVFPTLRADKRELLILRFVAGLTVGEIAAVLAAGEAATRKQLSRTLHALAAEFEGE